MGNITQNLNQAALKNADKRPDIQTAFYGLDVSKSPYLLVQHSPYLLNMKFHDSGQGLHRRDGHKVYKRFAGEKIVAATQSLNGDVYYITRNISSGEMTLHSMIKHKIGHDTHSVSITTLSPMNIDDRIDNFDIIVGFESGTFDVFPYYNIIKPDGTKTKIFLQTNKALSSIAINSLVKVQGTSTSPLPIVTHSYFNKRLYIITETTFDKYELHWGVEGAISLTLKIDIPNDDEVYAMKSFSDSLFIFCEDRVYKVAFDDKDSKADILVNSESYGITSNKLIRTIGSTIYYYGASSGLASMMGSTADSILDAASQQKPSDYYMSNFHKVFKADKMCYKKDDKSIYIIGSVNCDYITEAIHWQKYRINKSMDADQYKASLDSFKTSIDKKNRFIVEYNVAMQRFSLHYYEKDIIGHYNFRMKLPGLRKDQSSELIITEDYIATTSGDFDTDDDEQFIVQINSIPRSQGVFEGFITSSFTTNVKFCTNKIPLEEYVYNVPCELPTSIMLGGYLMYVDYTSRNLTDLRVSQCLRINNSNSMINPSILIGFFSKNILVFEGFQVNTQMTAMQSN